MWCSDQVAINSVIAFAGDDSFYYSILLNYILYDLTKLFGLML